MIRSAILALVSANDVPAAAAAAAPITKISDTLGNLLQSSNEEGQLDQQSYQAFYNWCQQTFDVRKQALGRYKAIQQELESKLAVHQALNKQLKDETAQLQEESVEAKQDIEETSILRQHEHDNYLKEQKNIAGMLQMLNRAVDVLSTSSSRQTLLSVAKSVQQLAAKSNLVSDSQRDQLSLFVQETMNGSDEDTITESASVNQVLKELIGKFQSTMSNASLVEKQTDEQFSQLIALKKQSFMAYITSKDAKDATLAESLQRTAQDQRELQESEVVVKGGEEYLRNVQSLCIHKSTQWASRSQVRQDIIAIMQSVITELNDASAQLSAARYASQYPSYPYDTPYTSLMATDSHTQRVATPTDGAGITATIMQKHQELNADSAGLVLPLVGNGQAFPTNSALPIMSSSSSSSSSVGQTHEEDLTKRPRARGETAPAGTTKGTTYFIQMSTDSLNMQSPDAMFVPTDSLSMEGVSSSLPDNKKVKKPVEPMAQPPQGQARSSSTTLLQTTGEKSKYPMMGEMPMTTMMSSEFGSQSLYPQNAYHSPVPAAVTNVNALTAPKSNTYTAVRTMVQSMSAQIESDDEDEEKHKAWCSSEIAKNSAVEQNKETKVNRLNTKIDSERQVAHALDQDLELLAKEVKTVDADEGGLRALKLQERTGYAKYSQNHQMAQQIIRQAVSILQRFRSLTEAQSHNQPQGFLQPNEVSALSLASIDSLSQLLTRYEELRGNSDKAENQSVIDFQAFTRQNKNLLQVLMQTKNYKQSLRLQAMADLDNDTEDDNALKAQAQSVQAYVTRLRQACADVLQHYNERKERRSRNLEALNRAGQVINLDNADEVHQTLTNLAQKTDKEAAQLLKSSSIADSPIEKHNPPPADLSSSMSSLVNFATSFSQPTLEQSYKEAPPPRQQQASQSYKNNQAPNNNSSSSSSRMQARMESTNANILRDLSSLQDMSSSAGSRSLESSSGQSGGLSMLPAVR